MITLKGVRLKTGLAQKQFAPLLGMTQQAVARIESGGRRETKGHCAALRAIALLFDHGLIDELLKMSN